MMQKFRPWIKVAPIGALIFSAATLDGSTHHLAALSLRALIAALVFRFAENKVTPLLFTTVILVILLPATGLLWCERLPTGFDAWANIAGFGVILIMVQSSSSEISDRLQDGLLLSATFQALWAAAEWSVCAGRASAGFFNPNNLGAWLVLVGTAAAIRGGKLGHAVGIVCAVGVLSSGSRSALLTLGTVLLILLGRRSWKAAASAAFFCPVVFISLPSVRTRFFGMRDRYAFDRLQIWSSAIQAGWDEPWGAGLGDARNALRKVGVALTHGEVRFAKGATQAHCEWLQLWVELGWLGLATMALLLLGAAILVSKRYEKRRNSDQRTVIGSSGALALLCAIAIPASFGNSFRVPLIGLTSGFFLGLRAQELKVVRLERSIRLPLSIVAIAIVLLTLPASAGRVAAGKSSSARTEGQLETARFWSNAAVKIAPHDVAHHLLDASVEFRQTRNIRASLDRLEGIALRFPSNPAPPERMARLLTALPATPERHTMALELAEWRTRVEPKNALRWFELSRAAREVGDVGKQYQSLEKAVALEPNCARALVDLITLEPDSESQNRLAVRALRANQRSMLHKGYPAEVLKLPTELEALARTKVPRGFKIPSGPLDLAPP